MDPAVIAALKKWPNVPACHGWLRLDARGRWRLGEQGGQIVRHGKLAEFLNRNYAANAQGEWFVQNGPQRVYVALERTPYIAHVGADGRLHTHTHETLTGLHSACVDAAGCCYVLCAQGIVHIDDRDLATLLAQVRDDDGASASDTALQTLLDFAVAAPALHLDWHGQRLPLTRCNDASLAQQFGFVREPQPHAA